MMAENKTQPTSLDNANSASKPSHRDLIQGQLSLGKLLFLGGVSLVLSFFGPLSILAPVPLTMAFLLYGAQKSWFLGIGIGLCLWGLSLGLSSGLQLLPMAGIFTLALLYAFLTFRSIERKKHPITGLVQSGAVILGVWCLIGMAALVATGFNLQDSLTQILTERIEFFKTDPTYASQYEAMRNTSTPQAKLLLDTLDKPQEIVKMVLQWLPGALVVGTFFSLWVTMFVILRNSLIWRQLWSYPFGFKELVRFRVPDYVVYAVIIGFVFLLADEYLPFAGGSVIGGNILLSLSVFYFFQGFGITVDGLSALKIGGLARSLILIVTMFFAWRVVIIMGLFDTWINFRRFFKK
jgi:hypothetical protein